jgi:hypothetical protein
MYSSKDYLSWKENALKNAILFDKEFLKISVHAFLSYDEEEKIYNAHALEFDLVGEGKTKRKAIQECSEYIVDHITFCTAYGNLDKISSPAPDEFWMKFYDGQRKKKEAVHPKIPKNKQIPYRTSIFDNFCLVSA